MGSPLKDAVISSFAYGLCVVIGTYVVAIHEQAFNPAVTLRHDWWEVIAVSMVAGLVVSILAFILIAIGHLLREGWH